MKNWKYLLIIVGIVLVAGICFAPYKTAGNQAATEEEDAETTDAAETLRPAAAQRERPVLEILPTMENVSVAKNRVWAGAFQLVWNDLADELNKAPIVFENFQSETATLLNNSLFSAYDLSSNAYYKKWGLVSPELKQEVEQGIWYKFHEKSNILDQFDWRPAPLKYFLYAMLKKDLEYKEAFEKLDDASFEGIEGKVEYFGVTRHQPSSLKESVRILFYNGENDFALTLESKEGDLIHLYRTSGNNTLAQLYKEMKKKIQQNKTDHLRTEDEFMAPKLDFTAQQEFEELYNKTILPSGFEISKAMEAVQFKMDEVGAKLVAEAGIMVSKRAIMLGETGRKFHFTGPYVLFLEEAGKQPYFAAHITDPRPLQGGK